MNLDGILHKEELSKEEIIFLLNLSDKKDQQKLFERAGEIRSLNCSDEVCLHGILEFSNFCEQNCSYCNFRKENSRLQRYRMMPEEIIETAHIISNQRICSIVLHSCGDHLFDADLIAYLIYQIKQNADVTITLSLGERSFDEYRTWKIAGADRYLLKYATANAKLFSFHHERQNLQERLSHLRFLKSIGYETCSGSIIGLPMQTIEDIADDILMCKELDLDSAIFEPSLPSSYIQNQNIKSDNIDLMLKTIAVARIVLKKVHIPVTMPIEILDENRSLKALNVGANIVMSNLTPGLYKEQSQSYTDRICINDALLNYKESLQLQIESIGRKISNSSIASM